MPRAERTPIRERGPRPHTLVLYAGSSQRRINFLEWAFKNPNFTVIKRDGGEENQHQSVIEIARKKIHTANDTLASERILRPSDSLIVVAADIKTRIGTSKISRGKPNTPDEAKRMLAWVSRHAYPYYSVEIGSALQTGNGIHSEHDMIVIILDPDRMRYLTTDQGFEEYRQHIREYDSLPTGNSIDVTDIAAGLSFPALIAARAVTDIHFKDNPDDERILTFGEKVTKGIYYTGVGFSLDLLRKTQPEIDARVKIWPYLTQTANRCLGNAA